MDWNRLLQGLGGRLLRQALGVVMQKGMDRLTGADKPRQQMSRDERLAQRRSKEAQKRLNQVMKVGRRFWR